MTQRSGTVLRDGVWGDVSLGPRELALIDTAPFQRLRRVRQLGFTDLVFPGARHTRFEHSLGVFHVARLVCDRLGSVPAAPEISEADRRTFLAAALLHDVGHYPFSHAVEELEVEQIRRHEDVARDVITSDEVAEVLRARWEVDPFRVAALVAGPDAGDEPLGEAETLLRRVLDSGLDVDKLDYLVRDARGANVPYGLVDVQRLVGCLTVWRSDDGRPRLAVEAKGISALQSLVFAKYLMFATVYWHHACRSAVAMLLRAIQEALRSGTLQAGDLERSDDAELLVALRGEDMPDPTRRLGTRLRDRRLYKRGFAVGLEHSGFARLERLWFRPEQRATLEDAWASACGAERTTVLLDIPEPKDIASDLPLVVDDDEAHAWDEVSGLGTADLERFQRWVRTLRVFSADQWLATELHDREAELLRA